MDKVRYWAVTTIRLILVCALAAILTIWVLTLTFGKAHAQEAGLSQAEQVWVDGLTSQRVQKLMQYEEERARLEEWRRVRKISVGHLQRASRLVEGHPMDAIAWGVPAKQHQVLSVWFTLRMPHNVETPLTVTLSWFHRDSHTLVGTEEFTIDTTTPLWQGVDHQVLSRRGRWGLWIMVDNRVLKEATFTVD